MTLQTALRVSDLSQNTPTSFDIRPDSDTMRGLAEDMNISALRKLRFAGEIFAQDRADWCLEGTLGATVLQPCVVTLDPVTTRIDVPVRRYFIANMKTPEGEDVEMPEDDATEPLGNTIDPAAIMAEALALALPLYPRKDGAALDEAVFTEPGNTPMRDEDARPFAGLSALRDKLTKPE